jgi:hypothetical protein
MSSLWEVSRLLQKNLRITRFDVVLVYLGADSRGGLTGIRILRAVDVKIILFVEQQATIQGVVEAIRKHAFGIFCAPFGTDDACHMTVTAAALSDWTTASKFYRPLRST